MKPIIEWLNEIEDQDVRERAVANCECHTDSADSISDAIDGGFVWSLSPEGWGYWNDKRHKYYERKNTNT